MEIVPVGVSSCLYTGISEKIENAKFLIERDGKSDLDVSMIIERYYNDIHEAVEFYNKYCIMSADFLNLSFEELKAVYEKYNEERKNDSKSNG